MNLCIFGIFEIFILKKCVFNFNKEEISEFRKIQANTMKKKKKLFENYNKSLKLCQTKLQRFSPQFEGKTTDSSSNDEIDGKNVKSNSYSEFESHKSSISHKKMLTDK